MRLAFALVFAGRDGVAGRLRRERGHGPWLARCCSTVTPVEEQFRRCMGDVRYARFHVDARGTPQPLGLVLAYA